MALATKLTDHARTSSSKAELIEEENTTTLRVPVSLRNNLKKIAAMQKVQLRELSVEILAKYVQSYEVMMERSIEDFSPRKRRS